MSSDTAKIFRWLSQAELDAQLDAARTEGWAAGVTEMREAVVALLEKADSLEPLSYLAGDVRALTIKPAPSAEGAE